MTFNVFIKNLARPYNFVAFLVGVLSAFEVGFGGKILVAEILMLAVMPFLLMRNMNVLMNKEWKGLFLTFLLAVASCLVSDLLINNIGYYVMLKGVGRILFTVSVSVFWVLLFSRSIHVLMYYMVGLLASGVGGVVFGKSQLVGFLSGGGASYQFGLSQVGPLVVAVVGLLSSFLYHKTRLGTVILLVAGGCFTALVASRSQAGSLVTAGLFVLISGLVRRKWIAGALGVRHLVFGAVCGLAVLYGVYLVYRELAPKGYLGEYQRAKYIAETGTTLGNSPYGLLLYSRAPSVAAALAAFDRPWWGFGSWGIPTEYLVDAYQMVGGEVGEFRVQQIAFSEDAGHSVIFGSWAASGVWVLPFWLLVFWRTLRLMVDLTKLDMRYVPFLYLLSISAAFSLWFNPLNAGARDVIGLVVAASFVAKEYVAREYIVLRRRGRAMCLRRRARVGLANEERLQPVVGHSNIIKHVK